MNRKVRARKTPGRRDDGLATKLQILEVAGAVFAEKGGAHTTGKEIAERARTNSAAVNYYFGGIDGLYAEVLVEAHHRLMDYEFLKKLAESPSVPGDKLNAFIDDVLRAVLAPASSNWALRVLSREMLHPSAAYQVLLDREILPKKQLILGFVSEILKVPADHPAVARCVLGIIGPIALLLVGSPEMLKHAAPQHAVGDQVDAVIAHFQRFITGGITAVAAAINQEATDASDSPTT